MRNVLIVVVLVALLGGYLLMSKKLQPVQTPQTATPTVGTVTTAPSPSETMMKKNEADVTLTENGFEPQTITVKVGEKIVWTNKSGSTATVHSNPHPIHTDYKPLNLGKFDEGGTLEFTPTEAGTYHYHDHLHPNRTGTVVVE